MLSAPKTTRRRAPPPADGAPCTASPMTRLDVAAAAGVPVVSVATAVRAAMLAGFPGCDAANCSEALEVLDADRALAGKLLQVQL